MIYLLKAFPNPGLECLFKKTRASAMRPKRIRQTIFRLIQNPTPPNPFSQIDITYVFKFLPIAGQGRRYRTELCIPPREPYPSAAKFFRYSLWITGRLCIPQLTRSGWRRIAERIRAAP